MSKDRLEPTDLRTELRMAIDAMPMSRKAFAMDAGCKVQHLNNCLSNSCRGTHNMGVDLFEHICHESQNERIPQCIASWFDGVFLPLPKFTELPDDGALLDDMLQVMDSVGTYGRELRQSLSDGDIDVGEWHKLNMCMQDIFRAVHLVQARAAEFRSDVEGEA
ncbi:MAG: hypothetical protein CSH37_14020 [Thalassolituus sp.]|nr:MAG: hypothetical protein CSH37_14020 [Thalassolituus sp.]